MAHNRPVQLALGSNLGDRLLNMRTAVNYLGRHGRVTRVSSLFITAPSGVVDQPRFFNAACTLETALPLAELLTGIKRIEWELGRRRSPVWGPRPIDLDILLAGEEVVASEHLTVPHPRLQDRGFVLVPLAEIAPAVMHIHLGRTVAQLSQALPAQELREVTLLQEGDWLTI